MGVLDKVKLIPLFNFHLSRKSLTSSVNGTQKAQKSIWCFSLSFSGVLLCFRDLSTETMSERKRLLKRGSLQDLFVSSPPFQGEDKSEMINGVVVRLQSQGMVPVVHSGGTGTGTSHGFGRFGNLRRRLMRRSWRPALGAIPE